MTSRLRFVSQFFWERNLSQKNCAKFCLYAKKGQMRFKLIWMCTIHPNPSEKIGAGAGGGGGGGGVVYGYQSSNQSIHQSTLFKHGKWLSKLVFRHAV